MSYDVRSLTVPSARIAISFDYDAWVNRNYVSQFAAGMGDSQMGDSYDSVRSGIGRLNSPGDTDGT